MAIYYVYSGAAGAGTGADWANAYTTLGAALAARAAGDTFYVAHDHAETAAAAKTLNSPGTNTNPCLIICANRAGSVPPGASDARTTATITTTGTNAITLTGSAYWYGITFSCATGASRADLSIADGTPTSSWNRFDNCNFTIGHSATGIIALGTSTLGASAKIVLDSVSMTPGSSYIVPRGHITWRDSTAFLSAPSQSRIFGQSGNSTSTVIIEGVDLSGWASNKNLSDSITVRTHFFLKDCALPSGLTMLATAGGPVYSDVVVTRCDSGNLNYRHERHHYLGVQTVETPIIRTLGANDGQTGFSWKISSTSAATWTMPFEATPIAEVYLDAGSNLTLEFGGLWDSAVLPKNDELWFEVVYMGSATTTLGTWNRPTKADLLATGSNLATNATSTWSSQVPARLASTAYSVGDFFKPSSSNRVFFCTTAGTTDSVLPSGYSTAADGDTVTDGTAVFRAGTRFRQSITLSSPNPKRQGPIYIIPKVGKASTTFYIDPQPL